LPTKKPKLKLPKKRSSPTRRRKIRSTVARIQLESTVKVTILMTSTMVNTPLQLRRRRTSPTRSTRRLKTRKTQELLIQKLPRTKKTNGAGANLMSQRPMEKTS